MLTPDDRLRLSHLSRRRRRRSKRCPLMNGNGTATHEWTVVHDASHRSYVEDKLSKKPFCPHLETYKDIATQSRQTHVWDRGHRAVPSCKFSRQSARDLCPRAKNTYFPYRELPWGIPSHVMHFWKALVEPMFLPIWHVTLWLTVFEIFAVKIWDVEAHMGQPPNGRLCVRDPYLVSCTISRRSVSPSPR